MSLADPSRDKHKAPDRWMVVLLALATIAFALFALFAFLAAYHYRSRTVALKADLQDEREDSRRLRGEVNDASQAVEERNREYDALRGKAGALLNQISRNELPPEDFRIILTNLKELGVPVYGAPLTEQELSRATQRLRSLLEIKQDGVVQPVEWIHGMEILAKAGFFPVARVPEAAELVQRELYIKETAKLAPTPNPAKATQESTNPSPTSAAAPGPQRQKVDVPEARFSATFAPDWVLRERELPNAVIAQSPRLQEGLVDRGYAMISGVEMKQDLLLEEYFNQRLEAIRTDSPGLVVERQGKVPVADGEGLFAVGVYPAGKTRVRVFSVVTTHRGFGYWLHFRARDDLFPRLEPEFLSIIQSFQPR